MLTPGEQIDMTIESACDFPYDEREGSDAAHLAAQAVIADLTDRRDIKRGFENVDEDTRIEIVQTLAAIIRECSPL